MKQRFYIAETDQWDDLSVLGEFKNIEENFFWTILESKIQSFDGITEEKTQELLNQAKEALNTGKTVTIKDMVFKMKKSKQIYSEMKIIEKIYTKLYIIFLLATIVLFCVGYISKTEALLAVIYLELYFGIKKKDNIINITMLKNGNNSKI